MGQLVKGGLLKPLDAYAEAYDWRERWSRTLLDLNRFSADGKQFGTRQPLRRLAAGRDRRRLLQQGQGQDAAEDVRGVRGDARQGEAGRRDADRVRQPRQVRRHPRVPDRPEPVHAQELDAQLRVRQERPDVRHRREPRGGRRSSRSGPTRATSRRTSTASATTRRGSSSPRARARSRSPAPGSRSTRSRRLGDKLGFFLMPGPRGRAATPVSLGGESLPWGITSKSKNADVAAAYIDFITNQKAADVQVETDNLPAMQATSVTPTTPVQKEIFAAWKQLSDTDGLTPYMDYATPTFFDDFSGAVQRLLGGKLTPERSRRACRRTTRSSPTRCDDARAAWRAAARRLSVPAAGAGRLRRCSCWRRCCTARGCRCSRGTA